MDRERRDLLRAVAAAGDVDLAGCAGFASDPPDAPPDTDGTPGTDTRESTADSSTATDTDPPTTATDAPFATPPAEPAALLSFDAPEEGSVLVEPCEPTLSGTVVNPYPFEILSGEISLTTPEEVLEVTPIGGTSFDRLATRETRPVEWGVTVLRRPESTFTLTAEVTYRSPGWDDPVSVETDRSATIDRFLGFEWWDLLNYGDYYDPAETPPGELSATDPGGQWGTYEADLSTVARFVKPTGLTLRFADAYPDADQGIAVDWTEIVADGDTVHTIDAGSPDEGAYLADDPGIENESTVEGGETSFRTASGSGSWTYDLPLPDDVDDLHVRIRMRGTFAVRHHPSGCGA